MYRVPGPLARSGRSVWRPSAGTNSSLIPCPTTIWNTCASNSTALPHDPPRRSRKIRFQMIANSLDTFRTLVSNWRRDRTRGKVSFSERFGVNLWWVSMAGTQSGHVSNSRTEGVIFRIRRSLQLAA